MKRDTKQLENLHFDFLHECCNSFHVFIPLKMSKTNWSDPTNRAVMHWCEMLKLSGIKTLTAEEIAKRKGKEGLYACTCPMYMHYLVCEHTLQLYMKTGIVTHLPKGGTPMQKKKGRKRKSHGGEARTFDE